MGSLVYSVVSTIDTEPTELCSVLECPNAVVIVSGSDVDNLIFRTFLNKRLGSLHNDVGTIVIVRESINHWFVLNNQLCTAACWATRCDETRIDVESEEVDTLLLNGVLRLSCAVTTACYVTQTIEFDFFSSTVYFIVCHVGAKCSGISIWKSEKEIIKTEYHNLVQ